MTYPFNKSTFQSSSTTFPTSPTSTISTPLLRSSSISSPSPSPSSFSSSPSFSSSSSSSSSPSSIAIKLLRLTPPELISQLPSLDTRSHLSSDPTNAPITATSSTSSITSTTIAATSKEPKTPSSSSSVNEPFSSSTSNKEPSAFIPLCTLPPFSPCADRSSSTSSLQCELTSPLSPYLSEFCPVDPNALLPLGFGNIYLGESLSFLLFISNTLASTSIPGPLHLTIELQTSNAKQVLFQTTLETLHPIPHAHQCILHHEMMELGTHILILQVVSDTMAALRKFYKFQVLNPFHLKIKKQVLGPIPSTPTSSASSSLPSSSSSSSSLPLVQVAMEFSLLNLTDHDVVLGPVQFLPSPPPSPSPWITVQHLTSPTLFDPFLRPKEQRHYAVLLSIPSTPPHLDMGCLQFTWYGRQGPGRLTTPRLMSPPSVVPDLVAVLPTSHPSSTRVHVPFSIGFQVTNVTSAAVRVHCRLLATNVFATLGQHVVEVPPLQPGLPHTLSLAVVALATGLHAFPALVFTDVQTQSVREINTGISVLVL